MEAQRAELDLAIADLARQLAWAEQVLARHGAGRRRMTGRTRMAAYTPPLRDIDFVLHDVLARRRTRRSPATPSSTATSPPRSSRRPARSPRDVLAPLNAVGDREGCRLENGVVRTPDGLPRGLRHSCATAAGPASTATPPTAARACPTSSHTAVGEMHAAANMAFNMYQA